MADLLVYGTLKDERLRTRLLGRRVRVEVAGRPRRAWVYLWRAGRRRLEVRP